MMNKVEYMFFYRPQFRSQVSQVLKAIGWRGQRGLNLLDIGCGKGLRLREFMRKGFLVTGQDFQPEVAQYVRSTLGITTVVGTADSLTADFSTHSFDVVTAFYLLEHIPSVHDVMGACFSILRPGGWFVAAVPVCDGMQARLFGSRWTHVTEAPRHFSLPSKRGLKAAASHTGFISPTIYPDSVLNCAGAFAGSLIPRSDLTRVYGGKRWVGPLIRRIVGGCAAIAAIPFCLLENRLYGQTSHAIIAAQKPQSQQY